MTLLKRQRRPKMGVRQQPQIRCPSQLRWVRGFQCAISEHPDHDCTGRMHAHHVRLGTDGGTGVKPGDNWAVPYCDGAHEEVHRIGQTKFDRKYGIDSRKLAEDLWRRSPHRRRVEG